MYSDDTLPFFFLLFFSVYVCIFPIVTTSCQRGHSDMRHCDKNLLYPVVQKLIERKLSDLDKKDGPVNLGSYRFLLANKSFYLSGFSGEDDRTSKEASETSLKAFLRKFKFRDPHDNDEGWTPLRCAALSGNEAIVRELISLGVDVEAPFPRYMMDTWITTVGIKVYFI